jgi:hypothetical protein
MANVPYSAGQSEVAPNAAPPDDYQHIQSSPADFGGLIAQGGEKLGSGLLDAGKFWQKVQTDSVVNDSMSQLNDLTSHALSQEGQDALNSQADVQKQRQDIIAAGHDKLQTPAQQLEFDNSVRSFDQRYISGKLITHYAAQGRKVAGDVSSNAFSLALNNVANAADDSEQVKHFQADARTAARAQVIIAGDGENADLMKAADLRADQAVYKTQIMAVLANDPVNGASRARALLEANKGSLGDAYAPLMEHVRVRANAQDARELAGTAIRTTGDAARADAPQANGSPTAAAPMFAQAAGAVPGGFTPTGLARTAQIESGGRAGVVNSIGMAGLMQFSSATWKLYGQGSPLDARAATLAAQKYAADNARALAPVLGRAPTDAELYIAHQQGGGGAKKLFANPNTRAGDLVGDKAIIQNGGDPNKPASAFTDMWINKFNKTPGATHVLQGGDHAMVLPAAANGGMPLSGPIYSTPPDTPTPAAESPEMGALWNNAAFSPPSSAAPAPPAPPITPEAHEALAVKAVLESDKTDEVKNAAVANIKLQFAQAQLAAEATAKARKIRAEDAAGDWVTKFSNARKSGQTSYDSIYNGILSDPTLTWETRVSLGEKLRKLSGEPDTSSFGPGWSDTRNRMMLPPDDPNHMTYQDALAAPGVTSAGLDDLVKMQKRNRAGAGGEVITHIENAAIKRAGDVMKLEQGFGDNLKIPNLRGQRIFDGVVAPYITSTVEEMASRGDRKAIDAFLDPANIDKFIDRVYPRQQRAADVIGGSAALDAAKNPNAPVVAPPAPKGIDPAAWRDVVQQTPYTSKGQPWKAEDWAGFVKTLVDDPSPENQEAFDSTMEKAGGLKAAAVLQKFGAKPASPPAGVPEARPATVEDALASRPTSFEEAVAPARPSVASAPAPAPATESTAAPATPPVGAFYGNEPAPTEKDAEAYAQERERERAEIAARHEADFKERSAALAQAAKSPADLARGVEVLRGQSQARIAAENAQREEAEVHTRLAALAAREKAGAKVGEQRSALEKELDRVTKTRAAADARLVALTKKKGE